jgi:outer membrane protein TolC
MKARIALTLCWLLAAGLGPAVSAQTMGLRELEQAAREEALTVRMAQEDVAIFQHRREAVQAQDGLRLSSSLSLASTREPVTDDVVRGYERTGAQFSARWPLLGGPEQARRAVSAAEADTGNARLRADQARSDAVTQLRLAYADAYRTSQRLTLGRLFLDLSPSSKNMLKGRSRDGLLLDADRQAFESMFETARRDAVREQAAHDEALARIKTLSGQVDVDVASAPRWDSACLRATDLGHDTASPLSEQAARQLAASREMASQQRWVGVDAGVSLTQSLSRDLGAASGHSTGVSVDIVVPFEWRRLRSASQAEAQARVRRAELELEAARQSDQERTRQALAEWRVREADRLAYAQRLEASHEALRVAQLRAGKLDGDVLEKLLQARYALYGAAVEASLSLQRLERAQAQMLALWPACEGASAKAAQVPLMDDVPTLLAPTAAAPLPPLKIDPNALRLAWFIWDAAPWLQSPERMLNRLPEGTERLMISLDGVQLRHAASDEGQAAVTALLTQAHARGWRVDLLLGEPNWALPAEHQRLLDLVSPLARLPFDGLNLDLERSQLPADVSQHAWRRGVTGLIKALTQMAPWRLTLTTHDRDIDSRRFARHLAEAGLQEVMPMIYATNPATARRRVVAVIGAASGGPLHVAVAQSVEPELPASESWHDKGRQGALLALANLSRTLADSGLPVSALAIQSFETFEAMQP